MSDDERVVPAELREFASLMVDELIATVRVKMDAGEGLTLGDQKLLLEQLIKDRARADRAVPSRSNDEIVEVLEMCAWQLEYIASPPLYEFVPGALAIQCDIKAKKARTLLSKLKEQG